MELAHSSLEAVARASGGVAEAALRPWAADLARGLCAVHRLGFLHLDVKPSNACGWWEAVAWCRHGAPSPCKPSPGLLWRELRRAGSKGRYRLGPLSALERSARGRSALTEGLWSHRQRVSRPGGFRT